MPTMLFDEPFYLAINQARWDALQRMMRLAEDAGGPIASVVDLGCGPGWFAGRLAEQGRAVLGLEGRQTLVEEARARAPGAQFETVDFDATGFKGLPEPADAVLCFGLLYHLENPIRALRMCRALCRGTLFLETMIIPEEGALGRLVPENPNETQGIRPLALILSPEAIAHAAHASGFSYIYRMAGAAVGHEDFIDTSERRRRREMYLCCDFAVKDPDFALVVPEALRRYRF